MAITPIPDLTIPQNVGYTDTDQNPIIHSIRWRHLPSRHIFPDVHDVITYHQKGPLVIDIQLHSVSYLDIYCLKSAGIVSAKAFLRFVTETDNTLVEEPYLTGEGGKSISLESDPNNPDLLVMRGIAFTQKDLGDGTPMYDFMNMTKEGIYEVWLKCVTDTAKELHVRIPFQWANLYGEDPSTGGEEVPTEPKDPPKVEGPLHVQYDEYYLTIVEGDSPFTKRPSTQFRMAAIGVLQNAYCYERISTPPLEFIDKPAEVPLIGDEPSEPCGLKISPSQYLEVKVGEKGKFSLVHSNTSGVLKIAVKVDETAIDDLGNGEFKALRIGTFPIKYVVTYEDGQQCTVTSTVVVKSKPTGSDGDGGNGGTGGTGGDGGSGDTGTGGTGGDGGTGGGDTTDPEPDPAPNDPAPTAYCSDVINGDSGYNSRKFDVTESGVYYIEYNFFSEPDEMFIYVGGVLKHRTGFHAYSEKSPFGFKYKPSDGKLKITMNRENEGTRWSYTLYCPSSVPDEVKANAPIVF
ncbi:hypothetical protein ECC01_06710 [Bacillus tequilensis]|uniref:hypothetical protein n=1 Tax=Aeromonas caviae TaxID=648 RepID=UPI001324A36D|nr:hypothetical protein [Bacillus tequilensis]